MPLHLCELFDGYIYSLHQAVDIDASLFEHGARAVVLLEHGRQQVSGLYVAVVMGQGQRLGIA